jgi:Protein of unknown function (DUF2971)
MTNEEVFQSCFAHLMADVKEADEFPRPLLAHYCSIATLESILKGKQLWLSNPLFMNDLEEVRFGVNAGMRITLSNTALTESLGDDGRAKVFEEAMESRFEKFANEHAFDLYIACFSQHEGHEDDDGRLSMWRAYGANGDGAALVFDVNPVSNPDTHYNGLLLGRVHYGTTQEREAWLELRVKETAKFIHSQEVPTEQLPLVAAALFERIKIMAIFSKHRGFSEEQEWRLVYMHEHDISKVYEQYLGYHLTPRGIEPKLKLPIHGAVPWHAQQLDITTLINRILLGPSVSNPLARSSIGRMLDVVSLPALRDRLIASSIPLRPTAPGPY